MATPPAPPNETQHSPDENEKFNAWNPKVLKQIDDLVAGAHPPEGNTTNDDLTRQLIVTALQAEYSDLARGDMKILSRAMRELRYGFSIFKKYRNRRKVTIFGSARTPKTHPEYIQARAFAEEMAKRQFMVITGAGPGVMEAGNLGAGVGNSFGINIRLPFEQKANEYIATDERFIDCRFFFTRKLMFLKETSAVAFFAGGFGTHDEGFETLTLVQTGKCDPMPVVFVDAPGEDYWADWLVYIKKQLRDRGKISPEDMSLFMITDSVQAAADEISHFYSNYHSLRFVKDALVIRLQKTLNAKALAQINIDFKDICLEGDYHLVGPFPEEKDFIEMPRLAFKFNRINFGRLRQLINRINDPASI